MMDFQIKRTGRHCQETDRELKPGEEFYSELICESAALVRKDYSAEAWQGPDANSVGWWRARIPQMDGGRVYWAPREVLLAYFESLRDLPTVPPAAYVMALLLVRKRILQWVDTRETPRGEIMELKYVKENKTYEVAVVELSDQQINGIQQELAEQLFMDQPPE